MILTSISNHFGWTIYRMDYRGCNYLLHRLFYRCFAVTGAVISYVTGFLASFLWPANDISTRKGLTFKIRNERKEET